MLKKQQNSNSHQTQEIGFDDLVASLFILVTHHSLTQCEASLPRIVDRLDQISHHPEIEFYPNQRQVISKMQQLWRTRLFGLQNNSTKH